MRLADPNGQVKNDDPGASGFLPLPLGTSNMHKMFKSSRSFCCTDCGQTRFSSALFDFNGTQKLKLSYDFRCGTNKVTSLAMSTGIGIGHSHFDRLVLDPSHYDRLVLDPLQYTVTRYTLFTSDGHVS